MRSALRSTWIVGLAVMFAGCLLPEYSVDKSLGSEDAGVVLPELPPPPANCGGNFTGGPAMVPVRGGYCIDSTEVTWAQYRPWAEGVMATPEVLDSQSSECSWNKDVTPDESVGLGCRGPTTADDTPVVCVDWCDAKFFCEQAGKHLCGGIGGAEIALQDWANPALSQWFNACTSGGRNTFPYAGPFSPGKCHTPGGGQSTSVQTKPECQSLDPGYAGVFDLSGNVEEWEDACNGSSDGNDNCRFRGGAFDNTKDDAACKVDRRQKRSESLDTLGFRCCWDPPG